MKKKVLKVSLIVLFLIIVIVVIVKITNNIKIKNNAIIADKVVNDIIKDKEYEVIVEINPKLSLIIKNGKVDNYECLNDDCNRLEKNFVGMKLKDAVESIYKDSKEKGFNVTGGVVLKSNEILDLGLSYVIYEDLKDESKTEEVKDTLLEELKKDEDYGIYYECSTSNSKLSCYIKDDIQIDLSSIQAYIDGTIPKMRGIQRVLNRFNIKTEAIREMGVLERPAYFIYINGIKFAQVAGQTVKDLEYLGNYNCSDHRFKLMDLDLLDPSSIKDKFFNGEFDIKIDDWGENASESEECYIGEELCYYERKIYVSVCNPNTGNFEATGNIEYKYYKGTSHENKVEITKEEYDTIRNKYISYD